MRSFDAFTGIGGITHGLRGVAVPVAYCENDEFCREVLERLMRENKIPEAPILGDIRDVAADDVPPGGIDILVGGSPCVGFSMAGKRRGLRDEASGLYAEFSRLARELRPEHVFFENVAALIQSDDFAKILADFAAMGYDSRWTTVRASDVGAPQKRRRVFLLASKSSPPVPAPPTDPHDWSAEPCPRMTALGPSSRKKFKALGNAAVPDQVAAAYAWLAKTWSSSETTPGNPTWDGACIGGKTYVSPPFRGAVSPRIVELRLDPLAFDAPPRPRNRLPRLEAPVTRDAWGTPRSSFVNANAVLTARAAKDLPTQLRFERDTPDEDRRLHPNPEWIAWLQGFPPGWV